MTNPNSTTIESDSYITGIDEISSDSNITSTTQTIDSDSYIREIRETILCDGGAMDDIVSEFGTEVVVRVVTKSYDADDEYSDVTETYVDYVRNGLIQTYTADDAETKEGVFKAGEVVIGFGIENESIIKPGNRILYANEWYEIDIIQKQPMMDVNYFLQARIKKI